MTTSVNKKLTNAFNPETKILLEYLLQMQI